MIWLKGGERMYHFKNFIPTRTKDGEWFSNQAVVIYGLINMYTYGHSGLSTFKMSVDCVGLELYDVDSLTQKQRQAVKNGFRELEKYYPRLIKPMNDKENTWEVDVGKFSNIDESYQYAYCYNEDFMKILRDKDSRTYNLAGFYIKFLSTFDYRYGIGRLSLSYIAKIMKMSVTAIKNNIDKLKELGVIKTYKGVTQKDMNGEYVSSPNIYYRPTEDKLVTLFVENNIQKILIHGKSQSP